ncbi:TauD/TfdA family dioxygenase [Paraburkholderia caballeronis]|uniref:Taurine catabolism dioxygenase TauD, TfdA family n=1 Tax=Paraburkholderia caballeronis TaxID=416943 RepID=A0A1H7SZZ4_9BURK|nr:TauD/TfdA family dioxygenase [Paraburkholderia caballeronis]PXW25713.1 TfdA family taurine catabolism dioxygenase TauD [Paraburkholderia caballeronis]PXX01320.1 TfdA family taurine catabolism dioxygenase TauD [Paraburkholderia caballeronis]RAJ99326.1 TfdA family taurine catabolism dioxygenase TauD [Paraburkholderia caballeronis]TDV05493.1 TfdA family taurine catabolism dioxygenase TauD [Paraburkholderia caballeronis]TDV09120.1 TfdA family taurine catabolism dioxygenase TauD [Paraburkholderi
MQQTVWRQPITTPHAWRRADLLDHDRWKRRITAAEQREVIAALRHAQAANVPMLHWQTDDFPLDTLRGTLDEIASEVRDGAGLVLLQGLDIAGLTDEEVCMIYWGLGVYLGEPLGQNPKGDLLGHVFDQGREYGKIDVRGYETSAYLPYHTDRAELLGLMCLRQGLAGGLSSYVSAAQIYNIILAEHPEYLGLLYNGFYYIRREEALSGNGVSAQPLPVFGHQDGVVRCRYIRNQINAGADKRGIPLTPLEREALDYLDSLTQRDDLRLDFMMAPGEIAFCNNLTTLHSRTSFVNGPEHQQQRHMLRLWLRFANPWPISALFGEDGNYVLHGRTVVSTATT